MQISLEQKELLREELDCVVADTDRDIEEALNAIRTIRSQDDVENVSTLDDDLERGAINAVLLQFEEVDEDALQ